MIHNYACPRTQPSMRSSRPSTMNDHVVESRIRYLTAAEGGRSNPVKTGYKGQFFYNDQDWDGTQSYPDLNVDEWVTLGNEVRAFVHLRIEMWNEVHQHHLNVGTKFLIREGNKTVGEGFITRLDVDEAEWCQLVPYYKKREAQ